MDRNTAFFHAKATKRSQIIQVDGLTDKNGVMCHTKKGMADIVVNYFLGLFDTSSPEEQTMDEVLSVIEPRMTAHENHFLTRPFTSKEVTDALSSMSPLKSHRPDDFPVLFYKKIWSIIGPNVISSVLEFLNTKNLPNPINFTFVVLIPKVKNPSKMTESRPFSLSNVIYKLGSKVIANRLKTVLPSMISLTHLAFVPNRLITDNVLLAFELNHNINSKPKSKDDFITLKLDVSKAYDREEWSFMRRTLLRLGLDALFINDLCNHDFLLFLYEWCPVLFFAASQGD